MKLDSCLQNILACLLEEPVDEEKAIDARMQLGLLLERHGQNRFSEKDTNQYHDQT